MSLRKHQGQGQKDPKARPADKEASVFCIPIGFHSIFLSARNGTSVRACHEDASACPEPEWLNRLRPGRKGPESAEEPSPVSLSLQLSGCFLPLAAHFRPAGGMGQPVREFRHGRGNVDLLRANRRAGAPSPIRGYSAPSADHTWPGHPAASSPDSSAESGRIPCTGAVDSIRSAGSVSAGSSFAEVYRLIQKLLFSSFSRGIMI